MCVVSASAAKPVLCTGFVVLIRSRFGHRHGDVSRVRRRSNNDDARVVEIMVAACLLDVSWFRMAEGLIMVSQGGLR